MTDWIRRYHLALLSVAAAAMFLAPSAAYAQENEPTDDEINAVAKGLYCPVCENVPLDVCPTEACKQWRDTIRLKLAEGWSQAEIEQYFVDQYGDRVLATPPATGLNLAVYFVPPLAVVVGAIILVGALRSWLRPSRDETVEVEPDADDPYIQRMEEELRRREQ